MNTATESQHKERGLQSASTSANANASKPSETRCLCASRSGLKSALLGCDFAGFAALRAFRGSSNPLATFCPFFLCSQ